MTFIEEIAALLDELNLGTYNADGSVGGNISLLALPPTPDIAIAIAPYQNVEASIRVAVDEPRFQIRCRGTSTDARIPGQLAQNIYDALHGMTSRRLPGGTWLALIAATQSTPIYIGRDKNSRFEYTVNFRAALGRPTIHREH